jgi:radical SAM superfamily enzyme YgiQ (UPF0313 family)
LTNPEIAWAREHLPAPRRVFLADGDALMAPPRYLHQVLEALSAAFPQLERVACYASPQALQVRTVEQMSALRGAGLRHVYLGVESGLDIVLERLVKGVDAAEMTRVAKKAVDAGLSLSTMILLGSAGRALSLEHARASARLLNAVQPRYASTLVMTPVEDTPLWEQDRAGAFEHLSALEITRELREFVAHLELSATTFRANHSTNHLVLAGRLPDDRERLLARLDAALAEPGRAPFVPDALRRI